MLDQVGESPAVVGIAGRAGPHGEHEGDGAAAGHLFVHEAHAVREGGRGGLELQLLHADRAERGQRGRSGGAGGDGGKAGHEDGERLR